MNNNIAGAEKICMLLLGLIPNIILGKNSPVISTNNVDKRVRECYDRMYQGVANGDYETFEAAYSEVRELMSGDFGEGDKCKARNAVAAWNRENSDIVEKYSESYSAMIERYNENRE